LAAEIEGWEWEICISAGFVEIYNRVCNGNFLSAQGAFFLHEVAFFRTVPPSSSHVPPTLTA